MNTYSIIVTFGMIYAAWTFEPNLLWVIGAAALIQLVYNVFWKDKPETHAEDEPTSTEAEIFFNGLKHSPWSKLFDGYEAKEKLKELSDVRIKAVYQGIQNELQDEDDEICCKNLRHVVAEIQQEIADRKVEAYRRTRRKYKSNYARIYADSLEEHLLSENLTDEQALKTAAKFSDAELVFVILDTPKQIFDTTAELTTGREEKMEAYYHNNLRRIEFLLRLELAKRFLESEAK